MAITGDMKQVLLQICIRENNRDVLWFHWIEEKDSMKVVTYITLHEPFLVSESGHSFLKEHWKSTWNMWKINKQRNQMKLKK